MKTILALLTVAFICSVVVTAFWAAKNWVKNTREEKRRLKNCQKTLNKLEK